MTVCLDLLQKGKYYLCKGWCTLSRRQNEDGFSFGLCCIFCVKAQFIYSCGLFLCKYCSFLQVTWLLYWMLLLPVESYSIINECIAIFRIRNRQLYSERRGSRPICYSGLNHQREGKKMWTRRIKRRGSFSFFTVFEPDKFSASIQTTPSAPVGVLLIIPFKFQPCNHTSSELKNFNFG